MTDIIERLTEMAQMGDQWVRPVSRDAITEIHRLRRLIAEGAHTKQAYRRGQEDMREQAAALCDSEREAWIGNGATGPAFGSSVCAKVIRALPIREAK